MPPNRLETDLVTARQDGHIGRAVARQADCVNMPTAIDKVSIAPNLEQCVLVDAPARTDHAERNRMDEAREGAPLACVHVDGVWDKPQTLPRVQQVTTLTGTLKQDLADPFSSLNLPATYDRTFCRDSCARGYSTIDDIAFR